MDNNLQQSVDTTEHDFLISTGYRIKMKCFTEWLIDSLQDEDKIIYIAMKRHLRNYDWGEKDSPLCLFVILLSLKSETSDHIPELFHNCRYTLSAKYLQLILSN